MEASPPQLGASPPQLEASRPELEATIFQPEAPLGPSATQAMAPGPDAPTLSTQLTALQRTAETCRRECRQDLVAESEALVDRLQLACRDASHQLGRALQSYRADHSLARRALGRVFASDTALACQQQVAPLEAQLASTQRLLKEAGLLTQFLRTSAAPVELRKKWNGSICGVYNERTGQVEWREQWRGGVCGVYNPLKGEVEWKTWPETIGGVWNPRLGMVEWRKGFSGGVHGVWNPLTDQVEWKTPYQHGVAGVWNPLTQRVEWREFRHGGVVGRFDQDKQLVVWDESWHHGLCVVFRTGHSSYGTCCCNVTNWYDDKPDSIVDNTSDWSVTGTSAVPSTGV